ncbi:MAG: M28 family peptidase [Pseudomonadota bacterium]
MKPNSLRPLAAGACLLALVAQGAPALSQTAPDRTVYSEEEMMLDWPTAAGNEKYRSVEIAPLKRTVEQLAAFSREYRDTVNPQHWGRIIGNSAHAKTMRWIASEFKAMGIADVRTVPLNVPAQLWPKRWTASVSDGSTRFEITSAVVPKTNDPRRLRPFNLSEVPVEYIGLGTTADVRGRDLRGKAVMIFSEPQPGLFSHGARALGAIERAEAAGAVAVIMTVGLPGNITGQAGPPAGAIPFFVVGQEDFIAARTMLEKGPLTFDASLTVETIENPKTSVVMAVLPGTSNESIFVSAHVDGYYEAAYDNGGGVAGMMELARFYSRIPQAQRRRTMYFVANPGHHEPHRVGSQWILKNMRPELDRAAVIMNMEHIAYVQSINYPRGLQRSSSASAGMAWYAGGSDVFRKMAIDSMSAFGVGGYMRPGIEIKDNPKKVESAQGIVHYGAPASDIMDLAHFAPFFQVISADWPYHTSEDKVSIVHWPALANVTRSYAYLIDRVNTLDLKDIQSDGHPLTIK